MKKILILTLLIIVTTFITGCYVKVEEDFYINELTKITLTVGDTLNIKNVEYDLESDILVTKGNRVFANKPGEIVVNSPYGDFFIVVKEEDIVLNVSANQLLEIGESTTIQTLIVPTNKSQEVTFESSNDKILTVNNQGVVKGITDGVATVFVKSTEYQGIEKEITFIVMSEDEKYYETVIENIIKDQEINIDSSNYNQILEGIINYNSASLVGISSKDYQFNKLVSSVFGAGIVYKMNIHYLDGTIKENSDMLDNMDNIKEFSYYVITNKHLVHNYDEIKIYLGESIDEIDAEVIQYDEKIDLAVLKFTSKYYIPICKLGNSDETEYGEFIISIGHGQGKEYFKTYTFGVVSGTERYVNTDTDNDGINDWDSEYIQHDAALNECDSGGAIVNMKGEIIGINSTKVSSNKYNNMSFAIPINLVMEIVSQLEQGIRPQRAVLGVQIFDVTAYHQNTEYYQQVYPTVNISKDIRYGFFVTVVERTGIAYKAGVKPGDIIVMFNNVELKYSYQMRAELGKFLIGSGEIVEMVVIRNNQKVTLYVEF